MDVGTGIYTSPGSHVCVWERLRGFTGGDSEVIGYGGGNRTQVAKILPSDMGFKTTGCGEWRLAAPEFTPFDYVPEGIWVVGEDVEPGIYASQGDPFNSLIAGQCYWARLRGFSGSIDDIIANNHGGERQVVAIKSSDVGFETRGCEEWVPIADTISSVDGPNYELGNGTWLVGAEAKPGVYIRGGVQGVYCRWERLRGFSGENSDVIANGRGSRASILIIESTDVGVKSTSCIGWQFFREVVTPVDTISDGVWLVELEIEPGIYAAEGGDMCRWDTNITWRNWSEHGGREIIEIDSFDFIFGTSGCGEWRPVAEAITPIDVVPDGTWLVGEEITPGLYTAQGGSSCSWERLRDFRGFNPIAYGYGAERQIVEILSTDEGFKTKGCGEWTRIG